MSKLILTLSVLYAVACTPSNAGETSKHPAKQTAKKIEVTKTSLPHTVKQNTENVKVIHVFVALCDNKYQGIVPVPKSIGNGQDENTNLYWGCGYGVRTYFKNSANWKHVSSVKNPRTHVLERCTFKHKATNTILVADAYDGQYMSNTLAAFFNAGSGKLIDSVLVDSSYYYVGGGAQLVAFVGHNGLMDAEVPIDNFAKQDTIKRDAIMLCCSATYFFKPYLEKLEMYPLLWTTNLMAPEAYTLHDAIETWLNGGTGDEIETAAATAYNKYQKCGMRGAMNLFKTGF